MSTADTQHYDVIIAGARCAGAATALLLVPLAVITVLGLDGLGVSLSSPEVVCPA